MIDKVSISRNFAQTGNLASKFGKNLQKMKKEPLGLEPTILWSIEHALYHSAIVSYIEFNLFFFKVNLNSYF